MQYMLGETKQDGWKHKHDLKLTIYIYISRLNIAWCHYPKDESMNTSHSLMCGKIQIFSCILSRHTLNTRKNNVTLKYMPLISEVLLIYLKQGAPDIQSTRKSQ
jgi:hypothetical protein